MKTEKRPGRLMIGAVLGFAAAGCLALWGCPLGMMDDYHAEAKTPDSGNSVVSDYNLQVYVPVPTAGAVPVKAVDSRRDLEVSVVWKDEDGNDLPKTFDAFVLDTVYQARITLAAKAGYSFDGDMSFKYYPADAVEGQPADDFSAGKRTLSLVTYKRAAAPIIVPSVKNTEVTYDPANPQPKVTFTFYHAVISVADKPADWDVTGTGSTVITAVYTGTQYGTNQTISFTATGASGGTAASGAVSVLSVRSFPTGGSMAEYTIRYYDPVLHVVAVRKTNNDALDGFLVTDSEWQKLFNAIYTPNAPGTTDAIESGGKKTIPYNEAISEAALNLFNVNIGGNARADDKVAIKGTVLPAASGANTANLIVIDIGVPGDVDNSGLKFFIPDRKLGASDNSGEYGHIRLRVNRGAYMVIEADNDGYINSGADTSCPPGNFTNGCVEVMAGGKLRDGAYEGFPLGSNAVILNRYGSYLGVGPEAGSEDAKAKHDAYADWYSGWLVGPRASGTEAPKIEWDDDGGTEDYLEVRPDMLAVSANMTVKKTVGLIYSVWLVGDVTVTIDAGNSTTTILGSRGLFANGGEYKIYATSNQAKIVINSGSVLHKAFLTAGDTDLGEVISTPQTIRTNGGTGDPKPYTDGITGYFDWIIPPEV